MNQKPNATIIWGTSEYIAARCSRVPIPDIQSKTKHSLGSGGFPIKIEVAKLGDASLILIQ
jgi:hypothetical protein